MVGGFELIENIYKYWTALLCKAMSKEQFFNCIDNLISNEDKPPYEVIELSLLVNNDLYEIGEYIEGKLLGEGRYTEVEVLNQLFEALGEDLLNSKQLTVGLELHFLNDEYGVLESPLEKLNDLYDSWVSYNGNCSDDDFYKELESIACAHLTKKST